jgi:hypothetical protein
LKKGTDDIYKGKIPFICFNCDGIGHFANKCPHKKKKEMKKMIQIEKNIYKGKITKKKVFKNFFWTKEDNSSSDEDEVNESET